MRRAALLRLPTLASAVPATQQRALLLYRHDAFLDRGRILRAEHGLSLGVIFHLLEDDVFERHLEHLFDSTEKWVLVHPTNAPMRDAWLT